MTEILVSEVSILRYLLITVGVVYIKSKECSRKDILQVSARLIITAVKPQIPPTLEALLKAQ